MQRAALVISRQNDIDPRVGRSMLPLWYAAAWPFKLTRWVVLIFIWRQAGLLVALAAAAAVWTATSLLPIPWRHFKPIFLRTVLHGSIAASPDVVGRLSVAIMRTHRELKPR